MINSKRLSDSHSGISSMISKPVSESQNEKLIRISLNFERRKVQTVSDTSRNQYSVGARAWFRFCSDTGINSNLSIVHDSMIHLSLSDYQTKMMGCFMSYLSEDEGIHPNSVSNYVSSLKDFSKREGIDLSNVDEFTISDMQKAIQIEWTKTHSEKSDSAKMPLTLDTIKQWIELTDFNDVIQFSIVLTAMLQFSQLMRISEVLPNSSGNYHFLRSKEAMCNLSFQMDFLEMGKKF